MVSQFAPAAFEPIFSDLIVAASLSFIMVAARKELPSARALDVLYITYPMPRPYSTTLPPSDRCTAAFPWAASSPPSQYVTRSDYDLEVLLLHINRYIADKIHSTVTVYSSLGMDQGIRASSMRMMVDRSS